MQAAPRTHHARPTYAVGVVDTWSLCVSTCANRYRGKAGARHRKPRTCARRPRHAGQPCRFRNVDTSTLAVDAGAFESCIQRKYFSQCRPGRLLCTTPTDRKGAPTAHVCGDSLRRSTDKCVRWWRKSLISCRMAQTRPTFRCAIRARKSARVHRILREALRATMRASTVNTVRSRGGKCTLKPPCSCLNWNPDPELSRGQRILCTRSTGAACARLLLAGTRLAKSWTRRAAPRSALGQDGHTARRQG